ncbi:MAG: AAA family ATPase [Candidatus Electrothrix scaldis]|nr:MAG: AAA family ATPase [Candidatus Electrothrix sp. GW3-3]
MLSEIEIQDFKSYKKATLPLSPLSILIGANASGKSNAIEALRILNWIAQGQKLNAINLVVVEEVDNGIHPSRARQLLQAMRELAEKRQLRLLLTTHNPALMDALPDEAIGDVVFCYRNPENGYSELKKLSALVDYPSLIAQGSLGHLVTNGVVERYAKSDCTPEQKKEKALAWLAELDQEEEALC